MNYFKEAKSLTFRRGSEVSQEYWCMNQRVMPMRVRKAFGDGGGVAGAEVVKAVVVVGRVAALAISSAAAGRGVVLA